MKYINLLAFIILISIGSQSNVYGQQEIDLDSARMERKSRDSVYIEIVEGGKKIPDKALTQSRYSLI